MQLLGEPAAVTQAQSFKGELFVLLTAALLFWLIGREERVQARVQDELKRTRSQLEHFIDTSASIIYALVPDSAAADGWRVSYVSGNVLRLTGYAPADWLERPSFWFEHVHPDARLLVQQAQLQLLGPPVGVGLDAGRGTRAAGGVEGALGFGIRVAHGDLLGVKRNGWGLDIQLAAARAARASSQPVPRVLEAWNSVMTGSCV